MTQRGNWKPLTQQRGNCGELNDLMRKTGNWALDDTMEHSFWGPFDDVMGKLDTLAIMKLGPPDGKIGP